MIEVILDRILIRSHGCEEARTTGGIIMPATSKEGGRDLQVGTVIDVGPGTPKEDGSWRPVDVRPGDRVHFGYHVGWFLRANDDAELVVIAEKDVVAVERREGL